MGDPISASSTLRPAPRSRRSRRRPGPGQYAVSAGVYSFAAADAGQALALSYGYVPQDLAQAALELAAERFRAAEHIGLRSKSIGGQETIAYDVSAIPAPVLAMLQPYKRVAF